MKPLGRYIRKHKTDIGKGPDELYFRGEKKIEDVNINIIDYNATQLDEFTLDKIDEAIKFKDTESVTWININGLHDTELMKKISDDFELDRLILADVMDINARPKAIEHGNCLFVSIKMLRLDDDTHLLSVEHLSFIITKNVLISFQEQAGDVFEPVRERIRMEKKRIRNGGPDYLLYALLDIVIDNYIYVLSELGLEIEALEVLLTSDPDESVIDDINFYKKELNFMRKHIKPGKEMVLSFTKLDSDFCAAELDVHLKELQDNVLQASDLSDSYREMLSDQLNIYHTTMSTRLNDVMKFLTVFSVVFIPLTFIAGIYGTNFENVPELHYKYSYFIMWGVMIVVALAMLNYFRRKRWL